MAFAGVPRLESLQFPFTNPSTRPSRARFGLSNPRFGRTRAFSARCSSSASASAPAERDVEDGLGPVTAFKMSDFAIRNHVSVGLAGRADEVIFEATVRNRSSPLYKTRVVLCKFTSTHAQRRGRRAIEVLKRLARRLLMYHSYAMQVHGYVCGGDHSSFTLVHGYHGSYSLRHWLQLSDWLPTLEATLALDEEESVRRVGDDSVGGPAISRQLRLTRVLMRDLLIAVNYLHSHGLAHTQLRLENVHVSPVDRHVKVSILGNAVDFYDNSLMSSTADGSADRRKLMIAFDMRCVGFIMAKMVLRDLMDPSIFMKFKSFFTKGSYPSCVREFLLPILSSNSPSGNAGLQILDRNWGAGLPDGSTRHSRLASDSQESVVVRRLSGKKWKGVANMNKEPPFNLPVVKLTSSEVEVTMNLNESVGGAMDVLREVRTQVPPEMFDVSKLVCGTYVDARLLVLRGVNGSALLFTRSGFDLR
ncbi:hypothetical protein QJS04_geneDACA008194 [Acorus gramineus]|uniref:Protein kinase domain-containing protein n=1 Tax=Acorus gramineus TaxID=55184 RepID=A0AAV9AUF3_ACOGR|nr:hypothetical protein QJS04_geneDACA008194 [Acorus gramineus]